MSLKQHTVACSISGIKSFHVSCSELPPIPTWLYLHFLLSRPHQAHWWLPLAFKSCNYAETVRGHSSLCWLSNKAVVPDRYPLPTNEELLHEDTSICVSHGVFCFKKISFGLPEDYGDCDLDDIAVHGKDVANHRCSLLCLDTIWLWIVTAANLLGNEMSSLYMYYIEWKMPYIEAHDTAVNETNAEFLW